MRKCSSILVVCLLALVGCGGNVVLISDTISPTPAQTVDAGQSVTFTAAVVNDPSNSGVTWSVIGVGTLSSVTATSAVYTAPSTVTAGTTAAVQAVPVKNSLYAAGTQILLSPGLAFTSSTLSNATLNTAYSTQLGVTGGSGALSYSLVNGTLPAGITLSSTGLISGTATGVGSYSFTVSVSDSATAPVTITRIFTLNVTAKAVSITTTSLPNGVSGTAYSQQFAATGGVTPYTWSITSGTLPTGLQLSSAGLLSGSPSATGVFTITVQVKDAEATALTASKSYTFTIYSPLTITTTSLPSGSVKNTYSATLAATGGTPSYTWALASGSSLPSGLSLSSAGVISGTPTAASTSTVTFQVTDSSTPQQTTTASFTLTIVLSTLTITTTSLPGGTVGVAYSATLSSSGGNPPVTWALATGSALPAGLTLSSAGVISGKPTGAGTTSFTVQATDSTPATVSQTLSINVVALQALMISTTSVPAGNIGAAYSTTLAATGGATPYAWTVASGALPPGLTLSTAGVLSGTPVAAGTYTFTAQVTDSEATPATATRSFTLTIGTTLGTGGGNPLLNGSYAFLLQGFRSAPATGAVSGFGAIGSLTANGSGTVTGTEDVNAPSGVQTSVALTGTYTLGTDGRGLMVLTAGTTTTVYSIAASNLSGGVAQYMAIDEFDNSTGTSGSSNASGFGKLQTASAFTAASVKGSYVFGLSGESPCASCATGVKLGPLTAVGVFTADGVSALSAGMEDAGAFATSYTGVTFTGSFTAPSTGTGRGTLHVTNTGTLFAAPPTDYTYMVVNAGELLLLSSNTHATVSLLAGDARLQTIAAYTTASLTGAMIGYESQAASGDGTTTLPSTSSAILSRVAFTGSGTATLAQDANRAGTFSTTAATATTYTTATGGRSALGSQVLYSYAANAGFALDKAVAGAFPALITYEGQVAVSPYPPLLSGTYAASTVATAAAATDATGTYVFALSTGGVNAGLNGTLATTLDTSSTGGTLTLGATNSLLFLEDATGRLTQNANGSTAVQGVVYAITAARAAGISTGTTTTQTVTVLQR